MLPHPSSIQKGKDLGDRWIQRLRDSHRTTGSWCCSRCPSRPVFNSPDALFSHALENHNSQIGEDEETRIKFRAEYERESRQMPTKIESQPRKAPISSAPNPPVPAGQGKRPLESTAAETALQELNIATPQGSQDVPMHGSEDSHVEASQPRKRPATGGGINSAASSPRHDSASPPPQPINGRPITSTSESDVPRQYDMFNVQRRQVPKGQLWRPDQDTPLARSSFDPQNIASAYAQKARTQGLQTFSRNSYQPPPVSIVKQPSSNISPSAILGKSTSSSGLHATVKEGYEIQLQPETRPISQEQLVAEVKGIYAGLVMVEAKCIEVDNKQAALGQANPGAQPKLNNEQWQALIALHRTLLHEHHDFFLASQHPSASPALRRLASKYAMPARMWRHGIHSFLELLRHRLPASLDHMLAFIYLAYSMMALLYETVPAFEDTWIECLGDLGRYRMAIEDDDIRDREVWTGVARHWYSKASDKSPTTGRLYHHLAILARPNALQQLFYYAKSLCTATPFNSARESILTLFQPVLSSESGKGHYRLPALDTAYVRAQGLLFTNRDMHKFEPTVQEFLGQLDSQIGRTTRKFMEIGTHISVVNNVALTSFASPENIIFKTVSPANGAKDQQNQMEVDTVPDEASPSMISLRHAQRLSNASLEIVLQRIGDPNCLPFINVNLVFMYCMARYPAAMVFLQASFPWELLAVLLNTLLNSSHSVSRISDEQFPLAEKGDIRPLPEDYAVRGLLWAADLFPEGFFENEKVDEEDKYRELPSMTEQRQERVLWLACRIAKLCPALIYDGGRFSAMTSNAEKDGLSQGQAAAGIPAHDG